MNLKINDTNLDDKSINLFSYLHDFVRLRSKVRLTCEKYNHVIWLEDIPRNMYTTCIYTDSYDSNASDCWIEISRPDIINVPDPPKPLAPWIHPDDLANSSLDAFRLLKKIPDPDARKGSCLQENGEVDFLYLRDHFQNLEPVKKSYLEKKWRPWALKDREIQSIQGIYKQIFSIYKDQQKSGEMYDIILALGLLAWRTGKGHQIKRHILTARADITFDVKTAKLRIQPAADYANIQFETDMLEPAELPDTQIQKALTAQIYELEDGINDRAGIAAILKRWVQSLHAEAGYNDSLSKDIRYDNKPQLQFSPAVIVRKKSNQEILSSLQTIIHQLKNGEKTPAGVKALVTISDPLDKQSENAQGPASEIYFPLPANEEQKEIIRVLNRQQGVVVQGPPGTGKSHTIANLLCHLLATGKRVLVTSHTPRALKVLKEKIPAELSALCVQALGNDQESMKELEYSVQGITDNNSRLGGAGRSDEIEALAKKLDERRELHASLNMQIRDLHEKEAFKHPRTIGDYEGTLQQIAQRLTQEEKHHGWLPDSVQEDQEPPLMNEEAVELYNLLCRIKPEHERVASFDEKIFENILLPQKFNEILTLENSAKTAFARLNISHSDRILNEFLKLSPATRDKLREQFQRVVSINRKVRHTRIEWVPAIVSDIFAGRSEPWEILLKNSGNLLAAARKLESMIVNVTIDGMNGRSSQKVKNDAELFLAHLKNGGRVGIGPFRPKIVKQCNYIISGEILINGAECTNARHLIILIDYLRFFEILKRIGREWAHVHTVNKNSSPSIQLAEYTAIHKALENTLSSALSFEELRDNVLNLCRFDEPNWQNDDELEKLISTIEAAEAAAHYQNTREHLQTLGSQLAQHSRQNDGQFQLLESFVRAVSDRNHTLYAQCCNLLERSLKLKQAVKRRDQLRSRLAAHAPILAQELELQLNSRPVFDVLHRFVEGWNWKRAHVWLTRMTDSQEGPVLERKLQQCKQSIHKLIKELAALKSWHFTLNRMSASERQHLISWKKAMTKIGKGTGKYVNLRRREARDHLNKCRSAIPAWIMPLYRVADTIPPQRDMFDVVIIDEASQSGPDALILQYYAKKIIVVGDDRQISPEYVGIKKENVDLLRREYLKDIPHNDQLGIENSFFDQAEIRYPNPVRLREHFRCMPEIINFSNMNWYQSAPLIPLRQYTGERLEPVVTRHVTNGYAEGDTNRVINKPEAKAIVNQILKCCRDERYADKTIGVISLQGETQARYIEELLLNSIDPEELEWRKIICGDAYAFQGDERDVVFLSMIADPERRTNAFTTIKAQRRFNVAASRARDQMWLFHSATLKDLKPICLRYKLLEYCLSPSLHKNQTNGIDMTTLYKQANAGNRSHENAPEPFDSWFEVDVYLRIVARGYRVIPQFRVAEFRIDLVVEGDNGEKLAVECDGDRWHGPEVYERDMARERMLVRSGWRFWRVRGSRFYRAPEEALDTLWTTLAECGIHPVVSSPNGGKSVKAEPVLR